MESKAKISYMLGLDIGTDSVGWSILKLNNQSNQPESIIKMGSRIFSSIARSLYLR